MLYFVYQNQNLEGQKWLIGILFFTCKHYTVIGNIPDVKFDYKIINKN